MIERKAFLQITKAIILGLRNSLCDPSECLKQHIIQELADILGVDRCVIFRVRQDEADGAMEDCCEIVAGVPLEEYGSELHRREPLREHPDIKAAVENGKMMWIKDPHNDFRTAYFRGIVDKKDISEILYVPLYVEEDGKNMGVIVIDAVHGRKFTEDERLFCSEVGELVSLLLEQERAVLQHFRDEVINKVVPLGGFAKRLKENLQSTFNYIEIIQREAVEICSSLPKKIDQGF